MTATRLLVLGIVRTFGHAHGYLVGQELLAWDSDKWANIKTGSIYHALRQLTKEGMLEASEVESSETGPPRTDYQITPAGTGEFFRLLDLALTEPEIRPDALCAGIVFISALDRRAALELLEKRRANLEIRIGELGTNSSDGAALPTHAQAIAALWAHLARADLAWVDDMIARVQSGAFTFADDGAQAFGTPSSRNALPQPG